MTIRLIKSEKRPEKQYSRRAQTKATTKRARSRTISSPGVTAEDLCCCQRLSDETLPQEGRQDIAEVVLLPHALKQELYACLDSLFSQDVPFSLFVLHAVQIERKTAFDLGNMNRRARYLHPASGFMRQLRDKVQRVLRCDDHLLAQGEGGALLFLPGVEQKGAYSILERLYTQVDLLEAETVIPPLKHETHIIIGCASYPEQGKTREQLLRQAEQGMRRVILRPRMVIPDTSMMVEGRDSREQNIPTTTPFLKLPSSLPKRLTRFIPYIVACELRCVPVGKEQTTLTVAMLDPQNRENISYLTRLTGMTIFPVACMQEDLDILLATKW